MIRTDVVRALMAEAGFETDTELGNALGVHRVHINGVINGTREPGLDLLTKMAALFSTRLNRPVLIDDIWRVGQEAIIAK